MIQLYVLSILSNGLSGYVLFAGGEGETGESGEKAQGYLNNPTFYLILGILSAVIGILKLLSPTLEGIPFFGDLIPAAAGIIAGILLIFGIYRGDVSKKSETSGSLDRVGVSLLRFRKPLGLLLLAVAFAHFLFPQTLFL